MQLDSRVCVDQTLLSLQLGCPQAEHNDLSCLALLPEELAHQEGDGHKGRNGKVNGNDEAEANEGHNGQCFPSSTGGNESGGGGEVLVGEASSVSLFRTTQS